MCIGVARELVERTLAEHQSSKKDATEADLAGIATYRGRAETVTPSQPICRGAALDGPKLSGCRNAALEGAALSLDVESR